jgi:hypothetical protein
MRCHIGRYLGSHHRSAGYSCRAGVARAALIAVAEMDCDLP